MSSPDPVRRYTVQNYLSWPDDVRCELIHGQVYDMTPAPSLEHQEVVLALGAALREAEYFRLGADHRYGPSAVLGPEDELRLVCLPALAAPITKLLGWRAATVQEAPAAYAP